jgi:hypothetical protein
MAVPWTKGYDRIEIYDRRRAFKDISQVAFVLARRGSFYGPFGTVEQAQEYGLHKAINDKNPEFRSNHGLIVMMTIMDFFIYAIEGC